MTLVSLLSSLKIRANTYRGVFTPLMGEITSASLGRPLGRVKGGGNRG